MEPSNNIIEGSISTATKPDPPIRILVETVTGLVPGKGDFDRTFFILDHICQYHWNCDFKTPEFRWMSYNAFYAFPNKRCFFVVDHGKSENDDDVPILCYRWTGEALGREPMPELAQDPKIRAHLKSDESSFTYKPPKRPKPTTRESIKLCLYSDGNLNRKLVNIVRENPEDLQWLKANLRPRFWEIFVAEANKTKPMGAEDIEE
ncbi:hypothetical protein FQN57_006556 [Myotisia sp. PD_48]|nr:hypothetical protein FQN57_006556 [Myotisia sp. PD_48]